jgi:APA family basic amino acid/polyamine antiporter
VTTLARRLGLFDLTMIATGASIGSGIFRTPSDIAAHAPSPSATMLVWSLGGLVTICGALTFAELGAMMPRAGGIYAYLSETYGDLVGFLHGWAYFLVVATGAIAALALVFAEYVGVFVPLGAAGTKALAVGALFVLAVVNIVGVRAAASFSGAMTVLKLGALAAIVVLGLAAAPRVTGGATPAASAPLSSSAVAAAMIGVLWSYGGWQHASFAAGEAKRPARDVPLGMVLGTGLVTLAYLATNAAYLRLMPLDAIIASKRVASDAVSAAVGPLGARLVALAIALSAVGTAGIYTLTSPRLYLAMAERGLFFRGVSELHPRFRTPVRAIVLQSTWAAALVVFWGTFENLISYVLFVDWIFFGLAGAAVLVLRRRAPDAERPYKVLLYPLTPIVFVAFAAWLVASTLLGQPKQAIAGGALLALGVPAFFAWRRRL